MSENDSNGKGTSDTPASADAGSPPNGAASQKEVPTPAPQEPGKKDGDRITQPANKETKTKPDTTKIVAEVTQTIERLDAWAVSYRNKEDYAFALIFLATFGATFIAAANLVLRQHVDLLGGWVLFCVVALLLNTAGGSLAWYVKATHPGRNKDRCVRFSTVCKRIKRDLEAEDLTPTKFTTLRNRLEKLEGQSGEYLLPASTPWLVIVFAVLIAAVIIVYFVLALCHLDFRSQGVRTPATTPQTAPADTHKATNTKASTKKE